MAVSGFGAAVLPDGWTPKFYPGLEAVGSVTWEPGAFKGAGGAMRCAWESGALKFGVEKEVKTDLAGWVDWIIEADIKSEGDYGYAGAAMSFLDGQGRDGQQEGKAEEHAALRPFLHRFVRYTCLHLVLVFSLE
jgi:hypothetical protein